MSAFVVAVVGPECAGKTTLARALAAHFGGLLVVEHARQVLEEPGALSRGWPALLDEIEAGQARAEDDARSRARIGDVIVVDTDVLTTSIWTEALLGHCPADRRARARERRYDVTLLCTPDLPWADDPVRFRPEEQAWFFRRFEAELVRDRRTFHVVSGSGPGRTSSAIARVSSTPGIPASAAR